MSESTEPRLKRAEELFRLILFKYGTVSPKMQRWIREWLEDACLKEQPDVESRCPECGSWSTTLVCSVCHSDNTHKAMKFRNRPEAS